MRFCQLLILLLVAFSLSAQDNVAITKGLAPYISKASISTGQLVQTKGLHSISNSISFFKTYINPIEEFFLLDVWEFPQKSPDRNIGNSLIQYNLEQLHELNAKEAEIYELGKDIIKLKTILYTILVITIIVSLIGFIALRHHRKMRSYLNYLQETDVNSQLPSFEFVESEDNKFKELYNRVITLMEDEQLFLQWGLSITDISLRLNTNEKYISKVINEFSGMNFNTFVNVYRVEFAKNLIINQSNKTSLKVVSIESGFSSHTTFYRQFKERTGVCPSDFIKIVESKKFSA